MAIPDGYYGQIAPRSGLSMQTHIEIRARVVDKDYRGEVRVIIFKHFDEDLPMK